MNASRCSQPRSNIRQVAIVFSGGPAPAANAVISTAAASFLRNDIAVLGIKYGYSNLVNYGPNRPMQEGSDYINITHEFLKGTRNTQGILIGTARANPGKHISHPDHFDDPQRTAPLKRVYDALISLGVDALISIGGDDTLKTANKFRLFQEQLPNENRRIAIVHLPKTIDNDYVGIDFTFGYFTAVDTLATEIRNLLADAEANRSYYVVQTMGRRAGWLAYGAAIAAGEASLVLSVEDIQGDYKAQENVVDPNTGKKVLDPETGAPKLRKIMNVDKVVGRIVQTMRACEDENKEFGVVVLAEGLAELLPSEYIENIEKDDFGNIALGRLNLAGMFAEWVAEKYELQTGRPRKTTGISLGYEARCARPQAFDVLLGSQLGIGAYRALVEEGRTGIMVSVSGQLNIRYISFEDLVDRKTLLTKIRYIDQNSDFYRLARFLESRDAETATR